MITTWPAPGSHAGAPEFAAAIDRGRRARLLIVPPLFDEMNRTRRLLVRTMRGIDAQGIDSFMPDLPGTNESGQPFASQSLHGWRQAMAVAAKHFGATCVLAVRGGALVFPNVLPGWVLEPAAGASVLRQLLRARVIAAREAGLREDSALLLEFGRNEGLMLAGYDVGAALIAGLESARPLDEGQREIRVADLGGAAPWLRAEPGDDPAQAARLTAILAGGIAGWIAA
ncbi:hypothetical protein [Novosphingobium sp.]|uniref:hypothetical protein n=1 Tax=Novosphingobium sp. TaxID=1874826 RepID=UPI00333FCAFF